ncbi:MAG: hypothetical protein FD175_2444 [Beijerinckiaceae bacterium]|nr:MAG: hypothetical protein FD175_2444 [Beijerinckiaceae bacterium]
MRYVKKLRMASLPGALLALALPLAAKEIRVSDRVFLVRDRPGTPTEFRMIVNTDLKEKPGDIPVLVMIVAPSAAPFTADCVIRAIAEIERCR